MKTQINEYERVDDMIVTSAETCALLRISRPTLHRYVRQKRLVPKRLPGGRLRFNRSDVLNLLA
jgi:excisionase family DNA binding protein